MASVTSATPPPSGGGVLRFLTRTRGRGRLDLTDWLTYAYLILGIVLMFGPVLWVAASSLKTQAAKNNLPTPVARRMLW